MIPLNGKQRLLPSETRMPNGTIDVRDLHLPAYFSELPTHLVLELPLPGSASNHHLAPLFSNILFSGGFIFLEILRIPRTLSLCELPACIRN